MDNLSELVLGVFYIILAILCVFIAVHSFIQIKNSSYTYNISKNHLETDKKKPKKLIIISLLVLLAIILKVNYNYSVYQANKDSIKKYQRIAEDLAITMEYSIYKHNNYKSREAFAKFLTYHLPIKTTYYIGDTISEQNEFSRYDAVKYKLDDFVNRPTFVTYDGTLFSIIKFKNNCEYVNKRDIGKSDCIFEVDLNNFDLPNQIGTDRTLFAVDGKNNLIKTDADFFRK